jgi:hypothetical protein
MSILFAFVYDTEVVYRSEVPKVDNILETRSFILEVMVMNDLTLWLMEKVRIPVE